MPKKVYVYDRVIWCRSKITDGYTDLKNIWLERGWILIYDCKKRAIASDDGAAQKRHFSLENKSILLY